VVKELFTFNDGRKYMGVFRDNKPWGITYCDKDGKIIGIGCEWSNTKLTYETNTIIPL
jgi:predicted transcriptional regulator